MYPVILTKKARNTYQRLTPKLKKGIDRYISYIAESSHFGAKIKKLEGEPGCYRYQGGGWRVGYEVIEGEREVRIYMIRPRGGAY
ncbi:MAG: hypothetical protein NTX88_01940 [Candidatus Atribacteria bacterium]|nr:hypothetical protein [Candidatus Atribacteria bacterium]